MHTIIYRKQNHLINSYNVWRKILLDGPNLFLSFHKLHQITLPYNASQFVQIECKLSLWVLISHALYLIFLFVSITFVVLYLLKINCRRAHLSNILISWIAVWYLQERWKQQKLKQQIIIKQYFNWFNTDMNYSVKWA